MTKILTNAPFTPHKWPRLDPERQKLINRVASTLTRHRGKDWSGLPYHPTEDRHLTLLEALEEWPTSTLQWMDDELGRREE